MNIYYHRKSGIGMTVSFDTFKSPEFTGSMNKLPSCQLLNDKSKPGLFIKEENVKLAGWTGGAKDGEKYTHVYNDNSKEAGLFFGSPRMHVILNTPRFIEITKKGDKDMGFGKKGTIVGIYDNNQDLYKEMGEGATLRTFYLLYLVGAKNENLHKVPFVLSVHGVAAAQFGKSLNQFYMMADTAYAEKMNTGYRPLNDQFHCLAIFNPIFEVSMEGAEEKSPVCVAKTFVEPSVKDLDKFFCFDKSDAFWAMQQSSAKFAQRYMKQTADSIGIHRVLPAAQVEMEEFSESDVEEKFQREKNRSLKSLQRDCDFDEINF